MPALATPPLGDHQSLAQSIAAATRPVHAKLNRLIVNRLPLALPPRASDPSLYLSGLLHIAPIYLTFEASWQRILSATPPSDLSGPPPAAPNLDCHLPTCRPALFDLLSQLQIPNLLRSDRLRADIRKLTDWSDRQVDEELHHLVRGPGCLAHFVDHIERAVDAKPHVLIAYSYIMYMALFAGGRFIRASLEYASHLFWAQTPSSLQPHLHPDQEVKVAAGGLFNTLDGRLAEDDDDSDASSDALLSLRQSPHAAPTMPLQFLHFSGPLDGEDLKRDYKQTLANTEAVLTSQEKREIVQEAVRIFEHIINIVHQLDTVCQQLKQSESESESETESAPRPWTPTANPLGYRFRDSVVVTKERKARRTVS